MMFEEGVLRTVFGCMKEIVAEGERKALRELYVPPKVIRMTK
jgi:hypothetical protein